MRPRYLSDTRSSVHKPAGSLQFSHTDVSPTSARTAARNGRLASPRRQKSTYTHPGYREPRAWRTSRIAYRRRSSGHRQLSLPALHLRLGTASGVPAYRERHRGRCDAVVARAVRRALLRARPRAWRPALGGGVSRRRVGRRARRSRCSSTSWEHMGRRPFGAAISGERCEIAAQEFGTGSRVSIPPAGLPREMRRARGRVPGPGQPVRRA